MVRIVDGEVVRGEELVGMSELQSFSLQTE
jgi:hypothetical protein